MRQQGHVLLSWKYKSSPSLCFLMSSLVIQLFMTLFPRELSCGAKVGVGTVQVDDLEELWGFWLSLFSPFPFHFSAL